MCDGMVACERPVRGTHSHALVALALQLLLVLNALPSCQASGCSKPSDVPHGRANLTETSRPSFPVGTVLQYSCDSGYTLREESVITCTPPGHWSPDPPQCIRNNVCSPPSQPENGGYMCHPSPCPKLTEGTVIEYFCDEGYTLKGYRYHTCQNGEWDSAAPIVCHLGQGKEERSPLAMPALSIVATTASSVALILLLVVLFVLLQPKLKSFHHSRREQGICGQAASLDVEGVQVSLPSYEEAVYGSGGAVAPPPAASRVNIVLSEGPQTEPPATELGPPRPEHSLPSTSGSSSAGSRHSETVLVHQVPSSSSSSLSSSSWAAEPHGAAAAASARRQSNSSSDQHSLLSLTSVEEYGDDIPLLKEA